jgi:mRNA interferase RelE/StbE
VSVVVLEVYLSNKAYDFLKKTDKGTYELILEKIKKLSRNPFPHNTKRVVGRKEKIFRIRSGEYRILYIANSDSNTLLIVNIDKRSKVYKLH